MKINIKEISVNANAAVKIALSNDDAEKMVKNPKRNNEKFSLYCTAANLLKSFLSENNKGKALIDDPLKQWNYHSVIIDLYDDEFDKREIESFTQILNMFDGMFINGDSEGNISFVLIMDDVYVEND